MHECKAEASTALIYWSVLHLVLDGLSVPLNNNQLACMEANMCDRVI